MSLHLHGTALIRITDAWHYQPAEAWAIEAEAGNSELRDWTKPDFDDRAWIEARGGFVGGPTLLSQATRLPNFGIHTQTSLFRQRFEVEDVGAIRALVLRLQYKHGLLLWLNGHLILNEGFDGLSPETLPTDALAALRPDNLFEERDLSHAIPFLVSGKNVLAAQVHASINQISMAFVAELNGNFARPPGVHQLSSEAAVISWRTLKPKQATLAYGLTPNMNHRITLQDARVEPEIEITNLHPGQTYYWQVALEGPEGIGTSSMGTFQTPDPQQDKMSFAVIGDSGLGTLGQYDVAHQIRQADPDLILTTGDTVYPSLVPELVDLRFYSIYMQGQRAMPIYPSIGNHDWYQGKDMFARLYHLPQNDTSASDHATAKTTPESYYRFDHGPASFFAICVPFLYQYDISKDPIQLAWLERELAASDRPWKIIYMHHPIRTSSAHRYDDYNGNRIPDTVDIRTVLYPLCKRYGVQLIFSGHDHVFERFSPVEGVVSVTTAGGGGRIYGLRERDELSQHFRSNYHFVKVNLEGDQCHLMAIDHQGTLFDRYTFMRHEIPQPNRTLEATWHSPTIEDDPANKADGNILFQTFDFKGDSLASTQGQFSTAGQLRVNVDRSHLYLGLDSMALPSEAVTFVFLGSPEVDAPPGPWSPWQTPIELSSWTPSMVAVLGDELADHSTLEWTRSKVGPTGPQGIFQTGSTWTPVPGSRIQQFDLNPQVTPTSMANTHLKEQDANFVEIAIQWEALPGIFPGSTMRVAVISGQQPSSDPSIPWVLDRSQIGMEKLGDSNSRWRMVGVEVSLPAGPDRDGDGLDDPTEATLATSPDQADTDEDGLPDGWEFQHGLDPLTPHLSNGPESDSDQDGMNWHAEFVAGTDPHNPESRLKLQLRLIEPQVLELTWNGVSNRTYRLEVAHALHGPYHLVAEKAATGVRSDGPRIIRHLVDIPDNQKAFYRLGVDFTRHEAP